MHTSELRHPSPGTVMGFLALVFSLVALIIALSGIADAARHVYVVKKGDIAPGAVTAKTLAHGAVHPKALAKGAVTAPKIKAGAVDTPALAKGAVTATALGHGAVTSPALAEDSVTSTALAPKSVYGAALGEETIHTAIIKDQDEVAENPVWTASSTGVAICGTGERLLQGGFNFTNLGNRQVSFLEALPILNAATNGFKGAFASNSGGSAEAQLTAYCLK
jgi:hypothetical protein